VLMRILSRHREVLLRDQFPYETRFRQYLQATEINGKVFPDFAPQTVFSATYEPFQFPDDEAVAWRNTLTPGPWTSSGLANDFYSAIGNLQDRPQPKVIAEKSVGTELAEHILKADPNARALFLVRDPRDTFMSIKAFNEKAGHSEGFGAALGDEAMFQNLLVHWRLFEYLRELCGARVATAQYECISRGDRKALAALFNWLGVDADDAYVDQVVTDGIRRDANSEAHATTPSVGRSIGRWRRESSAEHIELFGRYKAEIAAMGYSVE